MTITGIVTVLAGQNDSIIVKETGFDACTEPGFLFTL